MISVHEYGTRVGIRSDIAYATGTVVGYHLASGQYEVQVDGYEEFGTEMVPPRQLRPLDPGEEP